MRKLVLLSIFICFLIFLTSGCLCIDQGVNQNMNKVNQVNADVSSGSDLIEIDDYEFVEERIVEDIETISQKIGLALLPKNARPEEFEFRLWSNLGGLGDAKLLIVRLSENENHADFFDIHRALNPIRFRRQNLASPKSGWNQMRSEVRSRLTSPKGLIRDPHFSLSRDEPLILLEVLDKGEYRRVFYGQNTSFDDGVRLIKVCDYLAYEFGVDMNCYGERTHPSPDSSKGV